MWIKPVPVHSSVPIFKVILSFVFFSIRTIASALSCICALCRDSCHYLSRLLSGTIPAICQPDNSDREKLSEGRLFLLLAKVFQFCSPLFWQGYPMILVVYHTDTERVLLIFGMLTQNLSPLPTFTDSTTASSDKIPVHLTFKDLLERRIRQVLENEAK